MKRITQHSRFVAAFFLMTVTAGTACADWHSFWHKVHIGTHRNNAWPDPFNEADALQVVAPFDAMKRNGWRLNNTIGHQLFREGDGALLASGQNTVQWIATQAPQSRRNIYVLRGKSQAETEARIASVRTTLASIHMEGPPPNVLVTEIVPSTSSGAWATQINRRWMEEMPSPRLPSTSASGEAAATKD